MNHGTQLFDLILVVDIHDCDANSKYFDGFHEDQYIGPNTKRGQCICLDFMNVVQNAQMYFQ